MAELGRIVRSRPYAFAAALCGVLLIANIAVAPEFASRRNWAPELAAMAPLALAAIASTPSIVGGGGGLDVSVGPQIILANVVLVQVLLRHGVTSVFADVPIVLAIGALVGLVNGVLATRMRFQPVIATLCTLFVISGVVLKIASQPHDAPANWTTHLVDNIPIPGALYLLAIPAVIWFALSRTPYHRVLYAVGGNDATAYSAGVDVHRVRTIAYVLNGVFAAVGGIALTAIVQSTQATDTQLYTLTALSAVAIGGTPVYGGAGGLVCSFFGGAALYLVQTLLPAASIPSSWLGVVYGAMLVVGVVIAARFATTRPPGAPA